MDLILVFAPYVLVPFLMTAFYVKGFLQDKAFIWVVPSVLLLCYPFIVVSLKSQMQSQPYGYRCGMLEFAFIIGSLFVFLPVAIILQAIFIYIASLVQRQP
ncbi:hypothetical protein [Nibribacter koreensis]|uniref:hypothetical protein n=1 Tax=Nibribacter koreensis TaxID=1084519 RepID=UPI0031EA9DF7